MKIYILYNVCVLVRQTVRDPFVNWTLYVEVSRIHFADQCFVALSFWKRDESEQTAERSEGEERQRKREEWISLGWGRSWQERDGGKFLVDATGAVGEAPLQDPDCILHHYYRYSRLSPSLDLSLSLFLATVSESTKTRAECQTETEFPRNKWIERVEFARFDAWI